MHCLILITFFFKARYQNVNSINQFILLIHTGYGSTIAVLCENFPCKKRAFERFVWKITVYPKKYAHGFCFAVLCCGYTLTDFPISTRLTSLALWQSNDCPSASKATLMNMDKYIMWIHYERLHNHNKAKHNKTVCIFLWIYCSFWGISCTVSAHCTYLVLNILHKVGMG